jgi:hypothetical protein
MATLKSLLQVRAAFLLLITLILVSPAAVFDERPGVGGFVTLFAGLGLGMASRTMTSLEVEQLKQASWWAAVLWIVPIALIIIQLTPLPLAWSHPIWSGAAEALPDMSFGHLSIDVGETFGALIRCLTCFAILLVATATTIDRLRAEWLLYCLVGTTAFFAAVLLGRTYLSLFPLADSRAIAALHATSAIGTVLAAAAIVRAGERFETRRRRLDKSRTHFYWVMGGAASALLLCWLAVIFAAPAQIAFAATSGSGIIVGVVLARRFALPAAVTVGFGLLATSLAFGSFLGNLNSNADPSVRFAAQYSPAVSNFERMTRDNPFGTGAGTFFALKPIYQGLHDGDLGRAPTTAAQITIEMGRAAPWIFLFLAVVAAALFVRSALRRGRDSFYPTAAAACIVTLSIESFVDTSVLGTTVLILAMACLGLGLAQSASSRSLRSPE